ncbi:MAG: hypothetical protein ACK2UW_00295 [Anaerolineales bacterium]
MTTETRPPSPAKLYFNTLLSAIFFPAVTLIAAGNWRWLEGWMFGLWCDVMVISNRYTCIGKTRRCLPNGPRGREAI